MNSSRFKVLLSKSFARIGMIAQEFFPKMKAYGFDFAVANTMWWLGFYIPGLKNWREKGWASLKKHIASMVEHSPVEVDDGDSAGDETIGRELMPIWVFWMQGEAQMPPLVKMCYRQLTAHNRVTLLTLENLGDYISLPTYIWEKFHSGMIMPAHLADIVRVTLLEKYGGVWVDATCFVPRELPDYFFSHSFVSPHTDEVGGHWVSWCMATNIRHNPLFRFVRDMFLDVVRNNDVWPTYLLLDHLLEYAYEHSEEVKIMIDGNVENNVGRNDLHFLLNKPWNPEKFSELCAANHIFKLSYKTPWLRKLDDGRETFYGFLQTHIV